MAKAFNRRSQHVADDILATAAVLFDEQGYGQVSLQDIAEAIGIARPSLYHYFASKESILAALVERATQAREAIISTIESTDDGPMSRLRMLLRRIGESISVDPAGLRLTLNNQGVLPPDVRRRSVRSRRQLFELLVKILTEGADAGVLRPMDEHQVASTMIAALTGLQYRDIGGVTLVPSRASELMEEALVIGVVRPPDRQTTSLEQAFELLREDLQIVERCARGEVSASRRAGAGRQHEA